MMVFSYQGAMKGGVGEKGEVVCFPSRAKYFNDIIFTCGKAVRS